MKKKKVLTITIICGIIALYIVFHIIPTLALRTHLFMSGHPIIAFTTEIVDDEFHNKTDKQILESQNARCYTLTKPVFDKETKGQLRNYKVTKKGFIYFAEYYGEL
ncbi:hypothetical protein KQI41_14805 [Tissierella pigra]|uniref:Uncharacterized protein n=1 Tax=Tissierella pigra TaxID=2607614 RepID=A0A6N7XRM4_9FIRM|nr:hypothetical protein [Tissierella pigra]MBU5427657.1 hypothetical protein [Tissierella pigra]MSU00407.1 hypothetical protein [Tissierella pigra]